MKKNYCFVLSLFLFGTMLSSCEKSGNYQEFDRNEIYKHLSSVNVRDAKMIIRKKVLILVLGSLELLVECGKLTKMAMNPN